jgi:hypothetical protein
MFVCAGLQVSANLVRWLQTSLLACVSVLLFFVDIAKESKTIQCDQHSKREEKER